MIVSSSVCFQVKRMVWKDKTSSPVPSIQERTVLDYNRLRLLFLLANADVAM